MKRLFLLLLLPFSMVAQEWDQDVFYIQNIPSPAYPFSLSGTYINVNETHFRKPDLADQSLKYRQWNTVFAYTHPFNECNGLILGAAWLGSEVNMEENIDFDETEFDYFNFSAAHYISSFPDWVWTVSLTAYLDAANFSLIDYALYQGVLWGRYTWCQPLELDFGLMVEAGLRKEKVWPIIGFVFTPSERWRISAVYPIDLSIAYSLHPALTAAASIRYLRSRHRVGEEEPNSQAIFDYRAAGIEGDLNFTPYPFLSVTGFAGSTLNGDFEISNRNNKRTKHLKFARSLYAGVTAFLSY